MLQVKNLVKIYKSKKAESVTALNKVSIDFPETGFVFLLGKSGSGKSTLLNAIGGLDKFDEGEIIIKGKSSKDFSQADFDSYRNTFIGFIFQEYNILENFSVAKNLALALELQGKKADNEEVMKLLTQVEMQDYAKRKPNELSGGQKQRVAIARALIKNPEIIMADEPTGALDSNTGKQVMDTLKELSKTKLIIVVSHDREFAEQYGDRIIELKDGKILSDVTKKEIEAQEASDGIKIIDNNMLHIKKGKKVTEKEMQAIMQIINKNAESGDTFISLDKDTNEKLKDTAKITDDGNKEKFLKTEKEDVKLKDYNPNSLKLIKSRLKFSDSFKMGASSLKNKVGKLIFTILLSFVAFTLFGLVDAFACWNRADSVYQASKLTGIQNTMFTKQERGNTWRDQVITDADYKAMKDSFPTYAIQGVVGRISEWDSPEITVQGEEKGSVTEVYTPQINGYVNFTNEQLTAFGFTLVQGRLPQNNPNTGLTPSDENYYQEIAISKHMYESLKKSTKKDNLEIIDKFITINDWSANSVIFNGYTGKWKVVGVIDDTSDFSQYTSKTAEELSQDPTLKEEIEAIMGYSSARLAYVSTEVYTEIKKLGVNSSYTWYYDKNFTEEWCGYGCSIESFEVIEEAIVNNPSAVVTYKGTENTSLSSITLQDGEIIIPKYYLSSYSSDATVLDSAIAQGMTISMGNDEDKPVKTFKIVGYNENGYTYINSNDYAAIEQLSQGYSKVMVHLTNTESDREFIRYMENWNADGFRFVLQNNATSMLDMLDEIGETMTKVLVWVALGFAVFAAFLMMNFISTSISHKKREIGVLRALGARGSDIFGIFFNEATIIAFINFALAAIATLVGCSVINNAVISGFGKAITLLNPSIRQVGLILLISWGSALISSLIPSLKISKKRPIDAINNR